MQAAKARTWTTAAAVAVFAVVATAWPTAAAPWPPADIAGVDPASPLLAPVDVELEPFPPAPAERAEITLALQPLRSWAGLLDLGISSGETPSLSETRVWGFFLGSPDCVGLERLQVPGSTGDASFFARSLRHGVYFARNNPVSHVDPDGREAKVYSGGVVIDHGFLGDKIVYWGENTDQVAADYNRKRTFTGIIATFAAIAGIHELASDDEGDAADRPEDSTEADEGPTDPARQLGDRWKSTDDPLQQFEEIDQAQRDYRQGKSDKQIDSTEKSRQREKKNLRDIETLEDAERNEHR